MSVPTPPLPPEAVAETVAHDDLCPVCHLLLFSPVRTTCRHVLCASCMAQWADASQTMHVSSSALDLDLTAFDASYDPSLDLEANCPMCRTPTTAQPDAALGGTLERRYPTTYAERRVEEEVRRGQRVGDGGTEGIMILVGNRHRLVRGEGSESANKHDWTFFVRVSRPDLVKEVKVKLHPTFRPPQVVLTSPPFEVRRLGWGYFLIEAYVILKEGYTWVTGGGERRRNELKVEWMLDFEGRGTQRRVRGSVRRGDSDEDMGDDGALIPSQVFWPHMENEEE